MENELSDREVLIMKCVWEKEGSVTIQNVQHDVKEKFDWDAKPSTIRTFITSIVAKRYLKINKEGRTSYLIPLVSKEEYRDNQTKKMIDFWYGGSKGKLIKTLTEDEIGDAEVSHLMEVLDEISDN
ncbi:MAG: BlaI/MecI/CopY family transcriptional regulator [Anaerostipes sp.]|jgi:predicted transcriptional regulator